MSMNDKLPILKCQRCGHTWVPRKDVHEVRICPNPHCHSVQWDKPHRKENVK